MTRDQKLAHLQAWHDAMTRADATLQPVIDVLKLCGDDAITTAVSGVPPTAGTCTAVRSTWCVHRG